MPVLFDRRGTRRDQIAGRSPHMQAVHVGCADADEAATGIGSVAEVVIVEAHANSLSGRLDAAAPGSEIARA